jgi:hypothetical protein
MSLTEVLPAVRALPRADQTQLMHWLVDELTRPEAPANDREADLLAQLVAAAPFQIDRPEVGPEVVAAMQELLANHRNPTS